jgi:hypothetical protein
MHETTTLHFDLAHLERDQPFTLRVGTAHYALEAHTPQSLARARRTNRALALLPDDRITHHTGPVRLPADAPIMLRVHAPARTEGELLERLVLVAIHLPRRARLAGLRRRLGRTGAPSALPPKLTARVDAAPAPSPEIDVIVDVHDYHTAEDAAAALVFNHAELLTTQAEPADAIINDVILWARGINALANSILSQSAAHERDPAAPDWVRSEPGTAYRPEAPTSPIYVWSAQTREYLRLPLRDALAQSKNAPDLEHQCWRVQPGVVSVPMTPRPGSGTLRAGEANYTTRDLTAQRGVSHEFHYDATTSKGTVSLKNDFVRWLQVSVDQYGPAGEKVGGTSELGWLSSVGTIMSVPLPGEWSDYEFTFDERASRATVSLGGLGQVPFEWTYDKGGLFATGIFCYAVPTTFICLGVAVDAVGSTWRSVTQHLASLMISGSEAGIEGPLESRAAGSLSAEDFLEGLANFLASMLLALLDEVVGYGLKQFIAEALGEEAVEQASPFIGWVALAVGAAADAASIVETTVEVACSPATMRIDIERTMALAVVIAPDPRHGVFPETATHYTITVTYDDGTARAFDGSMGTTTRQAPIEHTFDDLPSGGHLTVLARFYSTTGWLAGQGTSGPLAAQPDHGSALDAAITITEDTVPLATTTRYSMKEKLVVRDGERVWAAPPDVGVPTGTVSDLDGSNVGDHLGDLACLALDETHHRLGYVWKASGQGIPLVGTGDRPYTGQEYVVQAISDGSSPQGGLEVTGHGRLARPLLAFVPTTMARPPADGLFLEADPEADVMWLRAVSLTASEPFVATDGQALGRFIGFQDDLAIHPSGYAVALNGATGKLQILRLTAPVADADAPTAGVHAGIGTRPGLLSDPVAVACGADRIVVLEQAGTTAFPDGGLAAFDVRGNPVACFAGARSTSPLRSEGAARVTVLDVSVEAKGYVYVLKYLDVPSGPVPAENYRLDVYDPNGTFLAQTAGLAAARLVVDLWRNVFTLNYEIVTGSGRTEPSVSQWIPSTPTGLAEGASS